jgi:hypothetical protein
MVSYTISSFVVILYCNFIPAIRKKKAGKTNHIQGDHSEGHPNRHSGNIGNLELIMPLIAMLKISHHPQTGSILLIGRKDSQINEKIDLIL